MTELDVRTDVDAALPAGLPMPRNAELLDLRTPRIRVRSADDRFPFPIPNGWFAIARSGEIGPGDVRSLRYFDRDLVVFGGDDGHVHLLDAYCPHLGAHLAVGGVVEGDCLRCPFHGWKFGGSDGRCVEIPYARSERIPPGATVRHHPVVERNGFVFAWHHLEDGDPFYDVPVVPEFTTESGWLDPVVKEFDVATACQEMAENNHDFAHFKYVHGTDEIPPGEEVIDGTYKSTKSPGLERETFGLGLGVVRVPDVVTFLSSVTPIDGDNVHVRWIFTSPESVGEQGLADIADQFTEGVSQDIPIWENKVYRPRPVLTKGERGIIDHRRWADQFYSWPDDASSES